MTAVSQPEKPDSLRQARFAWLAVLFLAMAAPGRAQVGDLEDLATFPHGTLEITLGKKRTLQFVVWLADTPPRQSQGLMFVRSLPSRQGMLFVHENPKHISMWMKNTYIPLDMVFLDARGKVQQIIENTTPHSLDIIRSRQPASAVLEIAGGEARRLGLKPGQATRYSPAPKR
jgi:uncharacterized protein